MFTTLTESEKQIILGTALGDGCLTKTSRYCHLLITHAKSQYDYLKWIYDNLSNIPKPDALVEHMTTPSYLNGRYIDTHESCYLCTKQHPFFSDVHALLCHNGKKQITRRYLNLLGPQALAIWWCDDGCCYVNIENRWRGGWFSTQSFSYAEHQLIKQWFRVIWGIDCKVYISKHKDISANKFRLFFNTTNMKRLRKLIYEYVPQCMKYKVDMHYSDSVLYNVDFLPTRSRIQVVEKKV